MKIYLNKNKYSIVDRDDFLKLTFNPIKMKYKKTQKIKWYCLKRGRNKFCAQTRMIIDGKYRTIKMHRLIMGVINKPSIHIDHKNGNPLDNRKSNLRFCNSTQNNANRRKSKNKTSKYLGVYKEKRPNRKQWVAQISINNFSTYIGSFNSEVEAAKAYNKKAFEIHGEFAHLNEI